MFAFMFAFEISEIFEMHKKRAESKSNTDNTAVKEHTHTRKISAQNSTPGQVRIDPLSSHSSRSSPIKVKLVLLPPDAAAAAVAAAKAADSDPAAAISSTWSPEALRFACK